MTQVAAPPAAAAKTNSRAVCRSNPRNSPRVCVLLWSRGLTANSMVECRVSVNLADDERPIPLSRRKSASESTLRPLAGVPGPR
jgi:hypothetical protein